MIIYINSKDYYGDSCMKFLCSQFPNCEIIFNKFEYDNKSVIFLKKTEDHCILVPISNNLLDWQKKKLKDKEKYLKNLNSRKVSLEKTPKEIVERHQQIIRQLEFDIEVMKDNIEKLADLK